MLKYRRNAAANKVFNVQGIEITNITINLINLYPSLSSDKSGVQYVGIGFYL